MTATPETESIPSPEPPENLAEPQDSGMSLEQGADPVPPQVPGQEVPYAEGESSESAAEPSAAEVEKAMLQESPDPDCELSPRTILEAMLFAGHPENEPLTSEQVAGLMRGVRPQEIDDLIAEINEVYQAEGAAYTIVSDGAGYRLALIDDLSGLRDKFHGRVRDARLTQAAIDVLAVVGYNQGSTLDDVDKLRGKPSGAILSQLVRRQLLRLERSQEKPRVTRYFTTERFLQLFGLSSLEELPHPHDMDPA